VYSEGILGWQELSGDWATTLHNDIANENLSVYIQNKAEYAVNLSNKPYKIIFVEI